MLNFKAQTLIAIKNGKMTQDEIANELIKTHTTYDIALSLAEYLLKEGEETEAPVLVTQTQFDKYFRIIGQRKTSDGEIVRETRGRKPRGLSTPFDIKKSEEEGGDIFGE